MKKMNETYEAPVAEIIEMVNTPAVLMISSQGGDSMDDDD
jgi:hypothetical protein